MAAGIDTRELLQSLIGKEISTVTGRPNRVLGLDGDKVLVGTGRSPSGEPVPVEWVKNGIRRLTENREVEISVPSLGHRSSFIGAVLLQLPGAVLIQGPPNRVRLADAVTQYRLDEAGQVNAWWSGDPRQRFWLEITDRPDIGVDLHCPQRDAAGNRNPGYSLIWWVRTGDIVFHYSLNERAIVAWSRASGGVTEAPTVWLSHRGATRRRLQVARAQPGWWLDLEGPFPLDQPLTLAVAAYLGRYRGQSRLHTGSDLVIFSGAKVVQNWHHVRHPNTVDHEGTTRDGAGKLKAGHQHAALREAVELLARRQGQLPAGPRSR
ncbi:MAG TPA: hypothetical protein VFH03_08800 [Actinoplanes sp.]|nr:hypothetical protein [Actinoplanes sp.]